MIAGFLLTQLLARIGGSRTEPRPVQRRVVWRQAAALAITAALGAAIALSTGLPHGYWLILTVSFVLRPGPHETRIVAVERSIGTLAGVVTAVAVAIVTPTGVALVIGAIALVGSMTFGLQWDLRMQHAFLTVTVVLVGSSRLLVERAELAAERLLLTALGALFAVAAALVLERTSTSTGAS